MVLLPLVVLFGFRLTYLVYLSPSITTVSFGGLWSKVPEVHFAVTVTVTFELFEETDVLFSVIPIEIVAGIAYPS